MYLARWPTVVVVAIAIAIAIAALGCYEIRARRPKRASMRRRLALTSSLGPRCLCRRLCLSRRLGRARRQRRRRSIYK